MKAPVDLQSDVGRGPRLGGADPGQGARAGRPDQRRLRRPPADPGQRAQGLAAVHGRPDAGDHGPGPDRPDGGLVLRRHLDRVVGPGRILKDLSASIADEEVLLVEDIIDTGLTLNYLVRYLRGKSPASLRICTLLDKPARRLVEIPVDYTGFTIDDRFVVGYGLDFGEFYRNLRYVGVLRPEVYSTPPAGDPEADGDRVRSRWTG